MARIKSAQRTFRAGVMPFNGQRLQEMMERRGISVSELARRLKTSTTLVGRYIKGQVEPGATRLGEMADILVTTADYLLDRLEDPEPLSPEERRWLREARSRKASDFNDAAKRLRKKMNEDSPKEGRVSRKKPRSAK